MQRFPHAIAGFREVGSAPHDAEIGPRAAERYGHDLLHHAVLHHAGELVGAAVERVGEPDELEIARRGGAQLRPPHALHFEPEHHVLQGGEPGKSSANWNTMPRSWPQPLTSRPSTATLPPDAV